MTPKTKLGCGRIIFSKNTVNKIIGECGKGRLCNECSKSSDDGVSK